VTGKSSKNTDIELVIEQGFFLSNKSVCPGFWFDYQRAVCGKRSNQYIYSKSCHLKQRYYSLDVFRGATVCLMILVNNPGSWDFIYGPLEHAEWHGLTPTDLVFPFFLFAVGNAMAFVMPRFEEKGDAYFWKKIIRRSLLIYGIGLFLNWWPFVRWQDDHLIGNGWTWMNAEGKLVGVRLLGVLQRISICYFLGSIIIYYLKPRGAFLAGLLLLLVYWLLVYTLGDPMDPYSKAGFFGNAIDERILTLPHMYAGEPYKINGVVHPFDPEGLMSTLPAIVNVIFGFLVGDYIRKRGKHIEQMSDNAVKGFEIYQTLTVLFVAAIGFLITGYIWDLSFPVNKRIWTSSYVVTTTGMALAILCTLIYAIEIKGIRNWVTRFFDVFGKNALFVFALSAFLPRGLRLIRLPNGVDANGHQQYLSPWNLPYEKIYKHIPGDPRIGSLCFALTVIAFMWLVCYLLDKKKIYIKV
jgi:predicted acyltransferase